MTYVPPQVPESGEPIFTFIIYVPRDPDDTRGVFLVPNEELVAILKNSDPR